MCPTVGSEVVKDVLGFAIRNASDGATRQRRRPIRSSFERWSGVLYVEMGVGRRLESQYGRVHRFLGGTRDNLLPHLIVGSLSAFFVVPFSREKG